MIAEQAAFMYALLRTPVALYPRSVFRRYFSVTDAEYSDETVQRLNTRLAEYRERERDADGQEKAFLQLLIQGAAGAIDYLESHDLSTFDPMEAIQRYYEVVADYYPNRLQLEWNHNPPVIVDRYPEPAHNEDWFAVSNVPGGPRPGYPQGIYFLRRYMMPDVAELATLHENVHHLGIGGAGGSGGYYRYFDEGCANFIAYLVYYHKNGSMDAVDTYRTFLQEFNGDLYESPSFDRILAAIIQQVGVTGWYRLILRRLADVTSVDWREVLRESARGKLRVDPRPGEPTYDELPPLVHELQEGADMMIARILYPDRMLMTPVTYFSYNQMCAEGGLDVGELQETWHLSQEETDEVVAELERVYLWKEADGELRPTMFRSDLFYDTGLVRAADPAHLRTERRALRTS